MENRDSRHNESKTMTTKIQMQRFIELTKQGYKAVSQIGDGIGGLIEMESPKGDRVVLLSSGEIEPKK